MHWSLIIGRVVLAGVLTVLVGSALAQQAYPTKPIRFILPNAPGGSNSVVARIIGDRLSTSWGQQVIVDNRPGGNNVIAAEALLRSNPDGYTILMVTASHAINPLLFHDQPYDPTRDFAPVATLVTTPYILVVNAAAVPANNLREFIALAKEKPGQLHGAGSNTGGVQHLALELFNVLAGVKLQHVPYKGGGPGMTDLLGGHVQLAFNNSITVLPHVNSGRLRALGVGSDSRLGVLPQVPTFAESGLQGFNVRNWFGVVAPARTSGAIITRLANDIAKVQSLPEVKERLAIHGVEPFISGPEQFGMFFKAQMEMYARIVKLSNITVER